MKCPDPTWPTIHVARGGIVAAIRLGLANGRIEGLNAKLRLISNLHHVDRTAHC